MYAVLRDFRGSYRRMDVLLRSVRGKSAMHMAECLKFVCNKGADPLRKLIMSAVRKKRKKN